MNALPSKKQHLLLEFIDGFIKENNYAPSYREVMRALDYKSVSTVAKHIDGLIERGWLVKRENSKRSLEVVYKTGQGIITEDSPTPSLSLSVEPPKRLSEQELLQRLTEARKQVEIDAEYMHYKGSAYLVTDVAIQTGDDGVVVVYRAQYGEKILFTRPLKEWLERVDVDGQSVERFRKT